MELIYFRYQYAEWKRLFPEPPKTGTSENRMISLAPDIVSFQRFHCTLKWLLNEY